MRFVCEACGKKYSSAGELKPGAVYRHKCKCGTSIVVKGPPRADGATTTPVPMPVAAPIESLTPAPLPSSGPATVAASPLPASSAPYEPGDGADFMAASQPAADETDFGADAPTVKRQIGAEDIGYYEPDAPTVRVERPGPPRVAAPPVEIEVAIEIPMEPVETGAPDPVASEAADRDLAALFAKTHPEAVPVEAAAPPADEPLVDASDLLEPLEAEVAIRDEPLVADEPPAPLARLDDSIFEDVLHPVPAPAAALQPEVAPAAAVGRIVLAAASEERADSAARQPSATVVPAKPQRPRRVSVGSVVALLGVALGFLAAGAYVHHLVGGAGEPAQRIVVVQIPVSAPAAPAPAAPAADPAPEPGAEAPRGPAQAPQESAQKPAAPAGKPKLDAKAETAEVGPAKETRPRVRPVKPPPEGWGDQKSGAGESRPGPDSAVAVPRQGNVASATVPSQGEGSAGAAPGGNGQP